MNKILILWLEIEPKDYSRFEDEIMAALLKYAKQSKCALFSKDGSLSEAKRIFHG